MQFNLELTTKSTCVPLQSAVSTQLCMCLNSMCLQIVVLCTGGFSSGVLRTIISVWQLIVQAVPFLFPFSSLFPLFGHCDGCLFLLLCESSSWLPIVDTHALSQASNIHFYNAVVNLYLTAWKTLNPTFNILLKGFRFFCLSVYKKNFQDTI